MALRLCREPAMLASVRAKLMANRGREPLFDTPRFSRGIEAAYAHMVERQQQGLPPVTFSVPAG